MSPYLVVAIVFTVAGFIIGRYFKSFILPFFSASLQSKKLKPLSREYFIGLNYLLDDEADDSVDSFIRSLAAQADDLDSKLALVVLLRRRGKVDESVSICQKILSGSTLPSFAVARTKLELARSYIAAGLLDRVEKLLGELTQPSSEVRLPALELAMTLYQKEKDWESAVAVAKERCQLDTNTQLHWLMLSHYYCELGDQCLLTEQNGSKAEEYFKLAMQAAPQNSRAYESMCLYHASSNNEAGVLEFFGKIAHSFPQRLSELVVDLEKQYPTQLPLLADDLLAVCDSSDTENEHVVLACVHLIQATQGPAAALAFASKALSGCESQALVSKILNLLSATGDKALFMLMSKVQRRSENNLPHYFCTICGFDAKLHHWQCPGCNHWSSFSPVSERYIIQQSEKL